MNNDASPPKRAGCAREKDAGSANSSAIHATEDELSRRPVRFGGRGFVVQQPAKPEENAVQLAEIVAIVAMVVAVTAGVGIILTYRRLLRYQRNQHVIMGSRGTVDIVEHVVSVDEKLANLRLAVEDLTLAVRDHDVRLDATLSRVGIVRFDAYHDLGGRQSTAVAFLNPHGDGVVITTVVSRDFARMYVKLIRDGAPDIPLAPEEAEALDQARGSSPFTIRPRAEGAVPSETAAGQEEAPMGPSVPMSAGLPGLRAKDEREVARENRRRKRRGLPLVEGKVVPSARGWDEPETPSLAERFVQQRRQSMVQPTNGDGDSGDHLEDTREHDEL